MRATIYRTQKNTQKAATLSLGWSLVIALIAGLSFVLALAPYHNWAIAIVSPLLLYALLLPAMRPRRALMIGWVYGFGVWLTGAFWLYTSIHEYGSVPSWLALLMIGVMAWLMGLFHGVMAWIFVRFLGRQPLAFAALWVVQEWLKTWLLTGFPWLFVGYAFVDLPFVVSLAPVVGVLGISFVSVLLSASLVDMFRSKVGYMLISAVLMACAVVLWLINPAWVKPTGDKLSVSLVQGNIPQDVKWLFSYQDQIMARYQALSAGEWGRDLVVWPEGAIPLFQDEAWHFVQPLSDLAKRQQSSFVTGITYRDKDKWANFEVQQGAYPDFYNAVMAFGASDGIYKKQRLVPFGEYIPLQGALDILPNLAGNQDVANHSAGTPYQPLLDVKGFLMGVAICYEVAYPNTTRQNAKDSHFLLTVSNDAWFGTSAGPYQHLQMVQMRSLETGRWFVRGTNNGITAIIDDKGRIVNQAAQFVPTVLRGEVVMMTGTTPFMRFGHYPILGLVAVLLGLSAWAGRYVRYFAKDGRFYQDYR